MTTDDLAPLYRQAIERFDPVIHTLLDHSGGFDNLAVERDHLPQAQLEPFLSELDIIYPQATPRKLNLAIRRFITELECFRYRVVAKAKDDSRRNVAIWDALEESLADFLSRNRHLEIRCRPNAEAYPSTDLIQDWIDSRVDIYGRQAAAP